ncbi:MAG: V-type ATP synthase subunit E family protein [Planctomycetota bacterium]|jgi:vacuolar-type H+-ATPase subunit E/Vma4
MEVEQVVEKILADARAEADKITKAADEKEAAEQAQLDEQLDEYKHQTKIMAEKAGADKKAHLLAATRMDIAKEHLGEKRKILDEVFAQAEKKLKGLPDKQYCELMEKLMLGRKLGPGYQGNLRLSNEKQGIGAGFILRRGKIKNNVSLNVLLAQARKALEIELAKELFGQVRGRNDKAKKKNNPKANLETKYQTA